MRPFGRWSRRELIVMREICFRMGVEFESDETVEEMSNNAGDI